MKLSQRGCVVCLIIYIKARPCQILLIHFFKPIYLNNLCTALTFFFCNSFISLYILLTQAESGDFNPSIHSIQSLKQRVATRFPNPVRSKMRALSSPTLSGSGLADDLALRAQALYARAAGKTKLEAQMDFLNTLRMWCPFYGSTFYDVQCQYDCNPMDAESTPPVVLMTAAIGPLAIFLITPSDPPVIIRHSYKRIIKWIGHPDKHIFTYWVIKSDVTLSDIERYQEQLKGEFDARPFCDCIYLVSGQVRELEYLVHSYVQSTRDVPPCLPGAPEELQTPPLLGPSSDGAGAGAGAGRSSESGSAGGNGGDAAGAGSGAAEEHSSRPQMMHKRSSRLGVFLSALGSSGGANGATRVTTAAGTEGIGLAGDPAVDCGEVGYGDDTAMVGNSVFKNMYSKSGDRGRGGRGGGSRGGRGGVDEVDEDGSLSHIPQRVKYASDMSELQRIASESRFSDEEEDDDDDGGEDAEEADTQHARHKKKVDSLFEGSKNFKGSAAKHKKKSTQRRVRTGECDSDSEGSSQGSSSRSSLTDDEQDGRHQGAPPSASKGAAAGIPGRKTSIVKRASSFFGLGGGGSGGGGSSGANGKGANDHINEGVGNGRARVQSEDSSSSGAGSSSSDDS